MPSNSFGAWQIEENVLHRVPARSDRPHEPVPLQECQGRAREAGAVEG